MTEIHTVEVMSQTPASRPELSLPKIVAGALAAASAAVASSWLGVAGTVFGAVVVSVVATVGTALYSHSLERSQHAIKETIPVLATRTRADRGALDGPETLELSVATSAPVRRPISWSTVVVSCVATLALGFGVLTAFEAVVGKSASELTGSGSGRDTTLSSLVHEGSGSAGKSQPGKPSTSPTGPTPTSATSPSATTAAPTATTPPTTTGPTTTGPTSTGPTSTGPTSTGPTSTGPTSTGPTSTGLVTTVPTSGAAPQQ